MQSSIYRDDNYGMGGGVNDDVIVGEVGYFSCDLSNLDRPEFKVQIGKLLVQVF